MWYQNIIPDRYLNNVPLWLQGPGVLVGGAVVAGTGVFGTIVRSYLVKRHLAGKRKRKREACLTALKLAEEELSTSGTLSHEKKEQIAALNLSDLIEKLQAEKLTPSQALEAYLSKALDVNKDLNCLVEPIVEAKQNAEDLEGLSRKGLLYGVPVSIKVNYGLKGYDCDAGLARWTELPYADDGVIVKVLKDQGAIPFVKTNVPQTMISNETTNPIHGPTLNPYDHSRGVGGSSGGEGALLAAGGSILGFGSDIGGSVRIPASMCGVYSLKPTANRLSTKGNTPLLKGQTCVPAAYGPMARDVDSLVIAMKALLVPAMFELDPTVPPVPFQNQSFESKQKLKIGYFVDDDYFHTVPAMQRGVLVAKAALEKLGHEVVLWRYPGVIEQAARIWVDVIFGDGGEELKNLVSGDATDASFKAGYYVLSLPDCVKTFLYWMTRFIYPTMAYAMKAAKGQKTVSNWWNLNIRTIDLKCAVTEDWQKNGFDAVLCPGLPCTALPLGHSMLVSGAMSYTQLYNVLDFPAGSMPVTKVTKDDNDKMKDYPLKNPWHKVVKEGMVGSDGLPVNVQVAALPWHEETVLRVMKDLETSLKK